MTREYNCYLGIVSDPGDPEIAREGLIELMGIEPHRLIHTERGEEPDEGTTYVFSFLADVVDEDGDSDKLYDHYFLPQYPNLPYEVI